MQDQNNKALEKRLDVIIRLVSEVLLDIKSLNFNKTRLVKTLNSAGLSPLEISKIMGKKSATDIAPFLYSKNKKQGRKKNGR